MGELDGVLEVAAHPAAVGGDGDDDRRRGRAGEALHLHRGLAPTGDLVANATEGVLAEGGHEAGGDGEISGPHGAAVGSPEVVEVPVDAGRPAPLLGAVEPDGRPFGEVEEPLPMALLDRRQDPVARRRS